MSSVSARPLLKWVGGKRQLLPQLRRYYPASFGKYIEPFFGSGAVFFDLHRGGALAGHDVVLIDTNPDLIGCYQTVRDQPMEVAACLARLATGHARGGSAHYYEVRDARFNPEREANRTADGRIQYSPDLAAMLIYLNRTGFNGLFRVNASGAFNVPAGRYDRPRIADERRLLEFAAALQRPGVELLLASFDRTLDLAQAEDFVYFDPPYAPVSPTANFTSYTWPRFELQEQQQLQRVVLQLAARGCRVLLSNSTANQIEALYDDNVEARQAGLRAFRVAARRAVNSDPSRRGAIEEYLITNIEPRR